MDQRKLKVLLTVVDCGSFTRAGETLGYTQSGITQMMKSLEHEVGFPVFNKTHRGVSLTTDAESLLPAIRSFLSAGEYLDQEISFLKGAKKGTLKIGSYISCSIHWLPEIIQEFQKEYPDINFEISEGGETELVEWITNSKVDIAFTSYHSHQNYHFIHVLDDQMMAVFPKGHYFSYHSEIPLELYEDAPLIISDYTYDNDVRRILDEHKIHPEIKYTTTTDFSTLSMVEHNLGVTILPKLVLRGRTGNFEARPICPLVYRRLGMAISPTKDMSPAMKIFVKYARNYLLDE